MNPISFQAKIPIAKCQIYDTQKKSQETATIYEYDCKDRSDIRSIMAIAQNGEWEYGYNIYGNAWNKAHPSRPFHKHARIYSIENQKGKTICICDTQENHEEIIVKHLESHKDKNYKYAGQNMLAMLAKKVIDTKRECLFINDGQPEAQDFYTNKCGFEIVGSNPNDENGTDYELKREDIPYFIAQTEEKTKKAQINFTGRYEKRPNPLDKFQLPKIKFYTTEANFAQKLRKYGYIDTGEWCQFDSRGKDIQGPWKMHICAQNVKEYQDIANVVLPFLRESNVKHKCLGSKNSIHEQMKGDQAGKTITIYPSSNEEMERIAKAIDYIIRQNGLTKPNTAIQGDRMMGNSGRIFYRYEFCSGKYSDLFLNMDEYEIRSEIYNMLSDNIKWSADKGPNKLYRFGLYEGNRGKNQYLAKDMTPYDDIWLNFNPANPNSTRNYPIYATRSIIYPNAIIAMQLDKNHQYGKHIMDTATREWFVYDKTLDKMVRDVGFEKITGTR